MTVYGDRDFAGENDNIRLARDPNLPAFLDVYVNSTTPTYSVEAAAVQQIYIDGLGGNDTIDIEDIPAGISVTVVAAKTIFVGKMGSGVQSIEGDLRRLLVGHR